MNIRHSWVDRNKGPVIVKIYRGDTPIDRTNLGTPLVTLSQGETEWVDTTAVRNATYYYVYEAISANDRDVSQNVKVYANYRMGPGPNTFQVGDLNYGYLGELTTAEFISVDALLTGVGISLTPLTAARTTLKWHKWSRNGRVLYIPNQALVAKISWLQLYNLGLVYGTGDAGKGAFLPTPKVPQNKRIKIGPDTFVVRLMTGYSDNLADFPETVVPDKDPTDDLRCEWDDLIFPLAVLVPNKQRMVNVGSYTAAEMGLVNGIAWCQDQLSATQACVRGDTGSVMVRANFSKRNWYDYNATTLQQWYPVLELVNE